MNYNQDCQIFYPAHRPESFFPINHPVRNCETERVRKYFSCKVKRDSVFPPILSVLLFIPFEAHFLNAIMRRLRN